MLSGLFPLAVAARERIVAAASPGYAAWPALIGAEMVVNGDCSSGTGWTLGTGIAIALSKMTATTSSDQAANDGVQFAVPGGTYRNVFTIDTVSLGTATITCGDTEGVPRSTVGTFSQDIVAALDSTWRIQFDGATMQLDNFSVKSVGLLGVEADWAFSGSAFWDAGSGAVQFDAANEGDKAELTGAAKTSFDAAVSSSTACSVSVTSSANGLTGTIQVKMKGGTAVNFVFGGDPFEVVVHSVTSGTVSGFELIAGADSPSGYVVRVQCPLA